MENKITLKFPNYISVVAGKDLAVKICNEQIFPMLTENQLSIIYFPKEIQNGTSTFLEELIYQIENYKKTGLYTVSISAHNVRLRDRINRAQQVYVSPIINKRI